MSRPRDHLVSRTGVDGYTPLKDTYFPNVILQFCMFSAPDISLLRLQNRFCEMTSITSILN